MKELILNIVKKTNKTIVASTYGSEFAEHSFTLINILYMLQRDISMYIFRYKGSTTYDEIFLFCKMLLIRIIKSYDLYTSCSFIESRLPRLSENRFTRHSTNYNTFQPEYLRSLSTLCRITYFCIHLELIRWCAGTRKSVGLHSRYSS